LSSAVGVPAAAGVAAAKVGTAEAITAIGGNLPTSAALCGNTVIWKAAHTQIYSANMLMQVLKEAGRAAESEKLEGVPTDQRRADIIDR